MEEDSLMPNAEANPHTHIIKVLLAAEVVRRLAKREDSASICKRAALQPWTDFPWIAAG
jgi:hypothetical protein